MRTPALLPLALAVGLALPGAARAAPAPHAGAAPQPVPGQPPHGAPAAEPVAEIVRRCVAAYGGKAALARAARYRQEGSVTSLLHPGAPGRIVRAYARPGRLRVETSFPGSTPEVRIVDGDRGFRNGEEVGHARLAAMLLQAARVDLPALLAAWEAKLQDQGDRDLDGVRVRVLSLQPAPGLVLEAAVAPESGRILRSRGLSRDPGLPIEFTTTYQDFRVVEGVLVAFHELNWANGRSTGETLLEKVEFPAALPEATFAPAR